MKPNISDEEKLNIVLSEKEWQIFDCKRAAIKPTDLLETVVAFVNADGGTIALGLEDPRRAVGEKRLLGINENMENVSDFLSRLDRDIKPSLPNYSKYDLPIINVKGDKDFIYLITIDKSKDVHSLYNGDTYLRKGDRSIKIGSTEIIRLKYEKGSLEFENELTDINTLEDIDENLLKQYKEDNQSYSIDNWQFLKDNGLSRIKEDKFYITKAGVLLSFKNPAISLGAKCSIKITHYYGTEPTYTGEPNLVIRPFSIEGPLLKQIQGAIDYFKTIVRQSPPKLSNGYFKPTFSIPESAFQEAVTNAVVHRNYSVPNDIQIRFFDDRVEIESPGSYPGFITVNNIRTERFARNPIIQRTLSRFGHAPNLDIGEGVDRMFKVMSEQNLYDPLYIPPNQNPNSVLLKLLNQQKVEFWDTVNKDLIKNYKITNSEAKKITGIMDTTKMSRMFKSWQKNGLIEKVTDGYNGNTFYKKPGMEIALSFASYIANADSES